MSSISWTLLHVCMRSRHFAAGAGTGGTSGSSSVEQRGGRLSGRTGTCYCTMKNSSTCFNRRVFVLVRVSCIEHKGISQLVQRELKIRVDIDGGAIGVTRSPCPYPRPCVHRSVQQPCLGLFVGEERYRLVKEGNLLLGSLAKSERSWFVRSRPQRSLLRDDSSNQRYS